MTAHSRLLRASGPCPTREQWTAFRVGRVPRAAEPAFANHLERCPACAALLDTLPEPDDSLIADLRQPPSAPALPSQEVRAAVALVERVAPQGTPACEPADPDEASPCAGDRLGPYQLLTLLGRGGMGRVFKAHDTLMDRIVAVKVIAARHLGNAGAVARFRREMQALARLDDHPHIVRAYHADQEGETLYLVMEHVEGMTLAEMVRRRGPLPVPEACTYADQVADALQHVCCLGLTHRDLNLHNVVLADQSVKLLDFGLARLRGLAAGRPGLTEAGGVLGTPEVMAPEQWQDPGAVDVRADLYSLGCALYQMLTGQPVFSPQQYPDVERMREAHATVAVPSVRAVRPDVPEQLDAVVCRLLAKDPAERYATPAALREALRPFVPRRRRSSHGRMWVGAAAALLLLLALAGWHWARSGAGTAPPQLVRVESFAVGHWRGDPAQYLGDIGTVSPFALTDDDVQVRVRLPEAGYFYLLAFLPNGQEMLCSPKDPRTAPPLRADLVYPAEEKRFFGLTDGVGLEAFVLVASARPLPLYAEWKAAHGAAPWTSIPAVQGVWQGNGETLYREGTPRSDRTKRGVPEGLVVLQRHFRQGSKGAVVQLVAFPVVEKP
jgi:hypothetical protein